MNGEDESSLTKFMEFLKMKKIFKKIQVKRGDKRSDNLSLKKYQNNDHVKQWEAIEDMKIS